MNNCENCIEGRPRIGRLAGVTRTMRLAIFEGEGVPEGTPQDLTGLTVVVRVLRDGTNDIYTPDFVVEGTDNNVIKFAWPANRQAVGNYTLDVTMTDGSDNVNRVNWHGKDGIRLVQYSNQVYGEDATGQESSEAVGLVGYYTTNGVGMSAFDEWRGSEYSAGYPQTVAGFMAYLKQPATDAANAARQQMTEIQARADEDHRVAVSDHGTAGSDHTQAGNDHTRAEGDHTTAADDHRIAAADHSTAADDHTLAAADHVTAAADHTTAGNDHTRAASDHGTAADDHTRAGQDHQTASDDHTQAGSDHTQAGSDHTRAGEDHTRAGDDHQTASSDHTRAGEDHTTAGSDHTRAGEDHTQAGNDHTRAEADHEQAVADHQTWANKADKDTDAVEGNIAVFDASGNPVDGKVKGNDLADAFPQFSAILPTQFYGNYGVNSSGTLSSNSGYKLYRIPVVQGDIVTVYASSSVSDAALSFSTEAEPSSVTMIMMHAASGPHYYSYKVTEDGYIFVGAQINTYPQILIRKKQTELEKFGVSEFSYGKNVLQSLVGTSVSNTDIWGSGFLNSSGSVTSGTSYHYTKDYIPVIPGQYYSRFNFTGNSRLCYYDANKTLLGALSTGNATESVSRVLPANTAFIRISLYGTSTDTLAMIFQDAGQQIVDVPKINDLNTRMASVEKNLTEMGTPIENNLIDEFDKTSGWKYSTDSTTYVPLTREIYGTPVVYQIPVDTSAKIIHLKVEFQMTNKMTNVAAATDQRLVTIRGQASHKVSLRQQSSLYNTDSGLLTRRQFFVCKNGSDVANVTLGDAERDCLWGEPAYVLQYKGTDYTTAKDYKINIKSSGIEVVNGSSTVLETVSVDTDELVESVIDKINSNSDYLTASPHKAAGVKYSDCLLISSVPLCTSSGKKPWVIPLLIDNKWHKLEIIVDYNQMKSWNNIDGRTIVGTIGDPTYGQVYLGGVITVSGSTVLCPFRFRNLHIGYDYEDAEIIRYPDNVSGTITRLISNDSPYLMIFEGHGIVDGKDADGTTNDMDVTTDRLRTVFDYLRQKGFVPVTWQEVIQWRRRNGQLPKRCYTLMFDDFRIENYMDYSLRQPFVEYGVKPGLAIITGSNGVTRSRTEEVEIDGKTWTLGECFDAIIRAGWYPCSHTISHTVMTDVANSDFLPLMKECVLSCDKLGIYDDIIVYPTGSNRSHLQVLSDLTDFSLGVNIAMNGYNSLIWNKYRLIRNEIGTRKTLTAILAQIV